MHVTPLRGGTVTDTLRPDRVTFGTGFPFKSTADAGIDAGNRSAAGKVTTSGPGPGQPHCISYVRRSVTATLFAPARLLESETDADCEGTMASAIAAASPVRMGQGLQTGSIEGYS